ncbi:hypothetical protein H6P81_006991 [Aristolochia fimbriata]|uniref:Lipid desaturase domain-containing protein n=1 Tax=Aristolochia fimbriata TaxID=158543 RepID=A0AAV7EZ35_ARIFI|nr:hypothetical protein H6P81_006991 [Aristolochia fimbriata]
MAPSSESDHTISWTPVRDDAEFKLTWVHRAWFLIGLTSVAISLIKSIAGSLALATGLWPYYSLFTAFLGYLAADLTSGLYHWAIDNYGNPDTSIYSSYINTFQAHHKWPTDVAYYEAVSGTYKIARGVAFILLPLNLFVTNPLLLSFLGAYGGFSTFSAHFHEWAHRPKSSVPQIVIMLQNLGLLLPPPKHAKHHRPPHEGSFCTISGLCNDFLDNYGVLLGLEMIIFFWLGIRPRSQV